MILIRKPQTTKAKWLSWLWIEYDALLLHKFLDILQDLYAEDLNETLRTYPMIVTDGAPSPLKSQQGLCGSAFVYKEIKRLQNGIRLIGLQSADPQSSRFIAANEEGKHFSFIDSVLDPNLCCLIDNTAVPETSICPNSQKTNVDTPEVGSKLRPKAMTLSWTNAKQLKNHTDSFCSSLCDFQLDFISLDYVYDDFDGLNYMHMGAGKTWYGVPRDAAVAFVLSAHGVESQCRESTGSNLKGSAALSSLYETPRCDEFHELQEIHVIVKAGYGIEFAYVILSYNIVLKLGDPSPVLKQGQGETKSNPTTS
ncbi:hypothetical protein Tco_0010169 [Tanacetum coccineum]